VGGEPTLRPDLEEIVRTIRARRIVPFMFTNGLLLDRQRLEGLREAGLFGLMFSVLGVGEAHDAFVGQPGGFRKLLDVVDTAIDLGFFVSFNTTPTHELLGRGDFERLSQLAAERGIGLKFNYPALLGRYAHRYEALLDEAERGYLAGQLRKPHVSNDKFTTYFDEMCPAGHFGLYVTDSGEVTPCAYIPISFGNVAEEPIEAIHERMVRSPLFGRVHRTCLVGEDRDFIERFIAPTFGREDLPLRWDRHPLRGELVAN
jgi:MoaA/NifB/PqqE/SkfB family radical SAM enzyme